MKKFLFILSAGAIILLSSCSSKKEAGGMSDAAKKNLETHRAIAKMFETRDFSKTADYFTADAVDYAGEAPVKGADSIKASFERMTTMFASMKAEAIRELADDEYVMGWMKFTGTMTMDAMGMKKGDSFDSEAIEVSQYKDGKVIAHWTFMQAAEFMKMMGSGTGDMSMPPPPPAKDSIK